MRAKEFLTESKTTLNNMYRGHFPDRDDEFWDYVSPHEFDNPLTIQTLQRHNVMITLLGQYRVEHIDEITDMLDDDQQAIVQSYMNDPALASKVIVVADGRIIDGNHRALAAAIKGVPINYVDLADLEQSDNDETVVEKVNPDVFKRGFEKVKTFGKYTMVATPGRFLLHQKFNEPSEQFTIKTFVGKNQVSWVNFEIKDDHIEALDLHVDDKHRRRGIATAMYKFAKELGNDILPSSKQTALGKTFWATKSPVTEADLEQDDEETLNEYETQTDNSRQIFDRLTQLGYTMLGSGQDATVWAKDEGSVIKILMPSRAVPGPAQDAERGFLTFYNFCKEHPELPNLPKFIDISGEHHTVFELNGVPYRQIAMERLQPIQNNSFEEAMVWLLSDLAKGRAPWNNVVNMMKKPETWELDPSMANMPQSVTEKLADPLTNKQYGILYLTMSRLYHLGLKSGLSWDLHTENVMQRKDGTLVIVDPYFT